MALSIGIGLIKQTVTWTKFKSIVLSKALAIQYEDLVNNAYGIFALDGIIVYYVTIFKGTVPPASDTDQTQNDIDKADFETNYKDIVTNKVTTPPATYDGYAIGTTNPTLIAASDGSFVRSVKSDSSGRLITVGLGTAGTPAGGVISIQGVSGGQAIPISGTVTATNASTGATGASPPSQATYIAGLATTAAPTYTNNQLNAISLTLAGAIRIDGSAVTQPVSGTVTANAGTGNFTVVQSTAANLRSQTASESTTAAATGTVASLTGGAVTTAAPTYTTGQMNPLSLTTSGLLRVDGSGATQPVSGTVAATQSGTWNITNISGTISLPTGAATETSLAKLTLAQGSTTSGQSGTLHLGAVTTAAPTYTTAQSSPLSLTTAGALRVDNSAVTQPISGTVTVGNVLVVIGQSSDNSSNVTTKLPVIAAVATSAAPTYTNSNQVPLSTDLAGALRVTGTVTAANASVSTTGTAPPGSATYMGGSVTTAAPTYTTGQMNALSLTTGGLLRIDGSGVTQPVSGTVTAAQATAANLNATVVQSTAANLRSQTASESTTATATGTVASLTGGAVTTAAPTYTTGQMNPLSLTTAGALRTQDASAVAQGSTTSGQTGQLMQGAVTTAAPTYTTAQTSPLSLTTAGALRIDGSAVTQPISGTVTANTQNDDTASGSFTATAQTQSYNLSAGRSSISWQFSGTWTGTINFEKSVDGTNWVPMSFFNGTDAVNSTTINGVFYASLGSTQFVRTRTSGTWTGTANWTVARSVGVKAVTVLDSLPSGTNTIGTVNTAAVDTSIVGTLGALNATVSITPSGKYTIGGTITGTWVGTITAQGTIDGTNWFTVRTANKSTNDIIQTYTANDSFEFYSVAGCIGLRLQMTAYTSGTANIVLTGTSLATDAFLNYSGTNNDTGPPTRHLSIGSLTNDGTSFHPLYNSNSAPVGNEYALITRSMNFANELASFSPDPSSYALGTTVGLLADDSGNLQVRGPVLTDEGSFRDDFSGSGLTTTLSGTPSWTNGSVTVTGTGFQTGIKVGDYIKKTADANTLYVRVSSVDSDTSLTLESAYTGTTASAASVKSSWIPTIGASGAIAVGTSNLTITTGTTSGVINSIIRRGDYGPFTCRFNTTVSQRIANQDIRIGFSDTVSTLTVNIAALVQFTRTNNTQCNFVTSSSVAASDTQTTTVTLPSGTTASSHEYKIDVGQSQCTLSIDGIVVAKHNTHIPGPYDSLAIIALAANTAAAGSSTTLTIDSIFWGNYDRLQIDHDFTGEPITIQGTGLAGAPPTTGIIGAMAPDNGFTGAFSGLNSTWTVTMAGSKGIGFYLAAGTLIGTVVAELSFDGTTWFPTSITDPVNNITSNSLVFTSSNGAVIRSIELIAGVYQARVRISAFTSGTCNISIRATQAESTVKTITSTDGSRTTYSAAFVGLVAASSPTDLLTISGSASRTIRLTRLTITATQATAAQRDVLLIKRSSANTGGTSTTATGVPHDSNNAAATATVRGYTANPTALGSAVGTMRVRKVFIGTTTGNSDEFLMEFGTRNDQGLVLRGTGELACINLNGVSSGTSSFDISVTWTEE